MKEKVKKHLEKIYQNRSEQFYENALENIKYFEHLKQPKEIAIAISSL